MAEDLEKVELLLEIIITKKEKHQFHWFVRRDIKKNGSLQLYFSPFWQLYPLRN